jgi:hypothetical protein
MPTTVVDAWKIFLAIVVIIPILVLYIVLLISLLASAAKSRLHDPINALLHGAQHPRKIAFAV